MRENFFTVMMARLAGIPFRLAGRRPFTPPNKVLILKPCCLSQVMLTTPLLAALSDTYPRSQFDWAISQWSRPAVATNRRVSNLIDSGRVGLPDAPWSEVRDLIQRLRQEQYDSCIIPSRSSLLAFVAWQAGIPQRIGLNIGGRGFAHTLAVSVPAGQQHEALTYLTIATALGIPDKGQMEFFPSDVERARATQLLVDEVDWLGDVPLVILHPGGGQNPFRTNTDKRWPAERFVLLGNHFVRQHGAKVILVGAESDRPVTQTVAGLMSGRVTNLTGRITIGEIGALSEVASLYVGNDTGLTHIAAAVGCPTLAIFGPSDPTLVGPFHPKGQVITLYPQNYPKPFRWDKILPVSEIIPPADQLLALSQ